MNEDGTPVYHKLPKSWKEAKTDGERWRWAMLMVQEADNARTGEVKFVFASFLMNQFGVQTMADYGWYFGRAGTQEEGKKDESGTWALHTLGEDETIARLATGIKRFKLPEEFNYLKIFRDLADRKAYGDKPIDTLAGIFENRRQYPKAAGIWEQAIKDFGEGDKQWRRHRLNQIVGNWGQFEPVTTSAAGQGATVDFRFRNGKKVKFEAWEINEKKLLDDVKAYLKAAPQQLDWNQTNIGNIGWRLVDKEREAVPGQAGGHVGAGPQAAGEPLRQPDHGQHAAPEGRGVLADRQHGRRERQPDRAVGGRHGHREEEPGQGVVLLRGRLGQRRAGGQGERGVLRVSPALDSGRPQRRAGTSRWTRRTSRSSPTPTVS